MDPEKGLRSQQRPSTTEPRIQAVILGTAGIPRLPQSPVVPGPKAKNPVLLCRPPSFSGDMEHIPEPGMVPQPNIFGLCGEGDGSSGKELSVPRTLGW